MIPRTLHRTVPEHRDPQLDQWWDETCKMHPDWEAKDWVDPLDPDQFAYTRDLWGRCESGAQFAGLVRLEILFRHGGVYLDADVEVFKRLDPLLQCRGFAAYEDPNTIPDAVMGFEQGHPAVAAMIAEARRVVAAGGDAWASGPGVTTKVLADRDDVLVLSPGSLYQVHWLEKGRLDQTPKPWEFVRHHWAGSWLTPEQKARNARRQR